jgi:hypothetical protein
MTTRIRTAILLCACLLCPAAARAQDGGFLEWLQKMSGPGPFKGYGAFVRVYCVDKDDHGAWFCFGPADSEDRAGDERHIFALGVSWLKSFKDEPRFFDVQNTAVDPHAFDQISVWRFEPRYYYRFHRALDAGVGFGARRYSGEGFSSFTQWSITPASIVFTPGGAPSSSESHRWWRLVKLHLDESWIDHISAKDFGSPSIYEKDLEFLTSFSIELDPFVFVKGYRGRR